MGAGEAMKLGFENRFQFAVGSYGAIWGEFIGKKKGKKKTNEAIF